MTDAPERPRRQPARSRGTPGSSTRAPRAARALRASSRSAPSAATSSFTSTPRSMPSRQLGIGFSARSVRNACVALAGARARRARARPRPRAGDSAAARARAGRRAARRRADRRARRACRPRPRLRSRRAPRAGHRGWSPSSASASSASSRGSLVASGSVAWRQRIEQRDDPAVKSARSLGRCAVGFVAARAAREPSPTACEIARERSATARVVTSASVRSVAASRTSASREPSCAVTIASSSLPFLRKKASRASRARAARCAHPLRRACACAERGGARFGAAARARRAHRRVRRLEGARRELLRSAPQRGVVGGEQIEQQRSRARTRHERLLARRRRGPASACGAR